MVGMGGNGGLNMAAERATGTFRVCGSCRRRWASGDEFLDDPELRVIGLQVAGHLPEVNLIIFQHACGSSVSVLTSRLRFLRPDSEQKPGARDLFGTDKCRDFCLDLEDWTTCDRPCINAPDRELLVAVIRRKGGAMGGDEGR
jgi:hypothetical protein